MDTERVASFSELKGMYVLLWYNESFHVEIWKVQILKILPFADIKFYILRNNTPTFLRQKAKLTPIHVTALTRIPITSEEWVVPWKISLKCKILHRGNVKNSDSKNFTFCRCKILHLMQWVVSSTNMKNSDSENFTFRRCKIYILRNFFTGTSRSLFVIGIQQWRELN